MKNNSRGFVSLVGAGPGDPGLLTQKGAQRLAEADVIVYDRLASPRLLRNARPDSERIYVGKEPNRHALPQDEINRLLVERGKAGQRVVRLKGGDPYVFGRGGEEAEALVAAGVPFEVVPGVTSAVAAPAYAGIPLTHRDSASAFTVLTGHEHPGKEGTALDWAALARSGSTLVILMGMERLGAITAELIRHGKNPQTPTAVVRLGTRPEQRTVTAPLREITAAVEAAGLDNPAVVVVGDVVRLRDRLDWFERRPLFGRRVVVTRAREQQSGLAAALEEAGAEVVEFPLIRIAGPDALPAAQQQAIDAAIDRLVAGAELGAQREVLLPPGGGDVPGFQPPGYDWVAFTSPNGVEAFFGRLYGRGFDARAFAGAGVAAVGQATAAALRSLGIVADVVPEDQRGKAVAMALLPRLRPGMSILLPRGDLATDELPAALKRVGMRVDEVTVYRTEAHLEGGEAIAEALQAGEVDAVTFASSSTARNWVEALGPDARRLDGVTVVCIGPVTAQTCAELGLRVDAVAPEPSIAALVAALTETLHLEP